MKILHRVRNRYLQLRNRRKIASMPDSPDYLMVYKLKEGLYKKRFGRNGDGGYILCLGDDFDSYDIFISAGVANDVTFEKDVLLEFPQLKCIAFDGTINGLPNESLAGLKPGDQWIPVADNQDEWIQVGYCRNPGLAYKTGSTRIINESNPSAFFPPKHARSFIGLMRDDLELFHMANLSGWHQANKLAEIYDCKRPLKKEVFKLLNKNIEEIPNLEWVKKNIGSVESTVETNLRKLIDGHNNILLKMDIEGDEIDFFFFIVKPEFGQIQAACY